MFYLERVMNKLSLVFGTLLTTGFLWADTQCVASQSQLIESEARCVNQDGISIGLSEEEGAKVACMESKIVQNRCGPDGQLTRLHAYESWMSHVKKFEDACTAQGGKFAFQDPNFVEPQNESFCDQAIPVVTSNMFEEPLCNFRSTCPAVKVICELTCPEHSVASLF
jgi:hypothetical protein